MDKITYIIDNKIYINLTNKCSNDCDFCVRNHSEGIQGYYLWLEKEPSAKEIIEDLKNINLNNYIEVVFCGFGEPMYKWDVIKEVADYVHDNGLPTRINTNGQANKILGYDVTNEIGKYIDTVNVSLNATDSKSYQKICHSVYGEAAFDIMLDFARECVKNCKRTVLSVVDCIGDKEIAKAHKLADSVGAELRVREEI